MTPPGPQAARTADAATRPAALSSRQGGSAYTRRPRPRGSAATRRTSKKSGHIRLYWHRNGSSPPACATSTPTTNQDVTDLSDPLRGGEFRWQPLGTSSAVDTSADRQGEQPVADGADQLGNGHVICSGSRRCGWLLVAAWWVSFGTAVPFWSSFLADARHLPHGRPQAGTATSTSTARGQPRWRPSRAGIRPRGWVLHRSGYASFRGGRCPGAMEYESCHTTPKE